MNKEERIQIERERLLKLFADLDFNQLETAAGLIRSAAFLAVSLEDLEAEINANGYIDSYTNGASQAGEKISAAVQAYATLNQKYQSTIAKLLKIVPPAPKKPKPKTAEQIEADLLANIETAKRKRRDQAERAKDEAFLTALMHGTVKQDDYKKYSIDNLAAGVVTLPGYDPAQYPDI